MKKSVNSLTQEALWERLATLDATIPTGVVAEFVYLAYYYRYGDVQYEAADCYAACALVEAGWYTW